MPTTAARSLLGHTCAVMGSRVEITVVSTTSSAVSAATRRPLDAAVARLQQLERRWSRFRPDSEVSVLNEHAGRALRVSTDTLLLVDLAQRGWRMTRGRYDPTLLEAVRHAGYDRDLHHLPATRCAPPTDRPEHDPSACGRIVVDHDTGTVRLPEGCALDPGGIGKGLAADLVSADLMTAGIVGGCVNVGGDLRVWGPGPHDTRWRVAAADQTIAVTDAAVATSGTARRVWQIAGRRMHHLIDPHTLEPADTGVRAVTVVAGAAWQAEIYATAAVLCGVAGALTSLHQWGVDGLVVDHADDVHATARLDRRR